MGLETIAVATGLFSAATGVPQYFEQKKAGRRAEREQRKANRASQAAAQIEAARSRRQAIAQQRIARARNEASVGSEVVESSGLSGVQSSLSSQLGSNIAAQNNRIGSQRTIQNAQQSAANAMRRGRERVGMWNAAADIANIGMSFGLNAAGGPSANPWASNTP